MIVTGILKVSNENYFMESENGQRYFKNRLIWDGYIHHWLGQMVCARELPQKDYKIGQPIILMWPYQPTPENSYIVING